MSRALLNPIPDWPALSRLCHAVLCEAREEPFEGPLPDVVDLCSTLFLFLQDCVAVNAQDVVDTANSQTLSEQGELRLRVLAELDAFMHRSSDVCLAQERWSAMNCRDPTATPSVMLPSVTAEV